MRLARRLTLLVSVTLLVTSLSAPGAHADALRWGGVPVATPFPYGLNSTSIRITGVFAQTLQCTSSTIGDSVTINNVVGASVTGTITAFSWGGCALVMPLVSCTVSVNFLPWALGMRMDVGPPKAYTVVFPTVATMTITCAFGPPMGITTCSYTANSGTPPQDLPGTWTDATGSAPAAAVRFNNAPLRRIFPSAVGCGAAAAYSGTYQANVNALTLTP